MHSLRIWGICSRQRYADFHGLNLVFETSGEGFLKHLSRKYAQRLGDVHAIPSCRIERPQSRSSQVAYMCAAMALPTIIHDMGMMGYDSDYQFRRKLPTEVELF